MHQEATQRYDWNQTHSCTQTSHLFRTSEEEASKLSTDKMDDIFHKTIAQEALVWVGKRERRALQLGIAFLCTRRVNSKCLYFLPSERKSFIFLFCITRRSGLANSALYAYYNYVLYSLKISCSTSSSEVYWCKGGVWTRKLTRTVCAIPCV